VFIDIEPDTYNLDPQDLEQKLTRRTKAIMVVDVFGHPAEWDEISRTAEKYQLKVIDDSCEALGAEYKGRKIGQFGDAAAFAFYPNKQITTGEGGVIVTDNMETARICRSLRNQGRGEMGAWLEHECLGYNYRITEMSAALGISQIKRIDEIIAKRERVAQMYKDRLSTLDWVRPPLVRPNVRMAWFVYTITLREGLNRDTVMQAMMKKGIPTRGYFSPVHLQGYIRERLGTHEGMLPVTESVAQRTIALPFHGNLSEAEVEQVVELLSK
jgi:perosamine synthetase